MLLIFYDIRITWTTIYFNNKCCFHTTTVLTYNTSFKFDCINQYWNSNCLFCVNSKSAIIWSHTPLLEFSQWQNRIFQLDCLPMQELEYNWISCIECFFKNMVCNSLLHINKSLNESKFKSKGICGNSPKEIPVFYHRVPLSLIKH